MSWSPQGEAALSTESPAADVTLWDALGRGQAAGVLEGLRLQESVPRLCLARPPHHASRHLSTIVIR